MATVVRKQPGQTEDQLISQFRKKIFNEEVLDEIAKGDFFQKPSTIKHERIKDFRKKKKRKNKRR